MAAIQHLAMFMTVEATLGDTRFESFEDASNGHSGDSSSAGLQPGSKRSLVAVVPPPPLPGYKAERYSTWLEFGAYSLQHTF